MSEGFDVAARPYNPLEGAGFCAGSGPVLRLRAGADRARLSLRIAPAQLEKAIEAFGCPIAAKIGAMSWADQRTALCLGPDEWLLMAPETEKEKIIAGFAEIGGQTNHSLVDVSDRMVAIEITGPAAALVLNAGCPLDLEKMPVGGCARTVLDKAEVVLMKCEGAYYQLEVARSFAEFVWNFLSVAGRELEAESRPTD